MSQFSFGFFSGWSMNIQTLARVSNYYGCNKNSYKENRITWTCRTVRNFSLVTCLRHSCIVGRLAESIFSWFSTKFKLAGAGQNSIVMSIHWNSVPFKILVFDVSTYSCPGSTSCSRIGGQDSSEHPSRWSKSSSLSTHSKFRSCDWIHWEMEFRLFTTKIECKGGISFDF